MDELPFQRAMCVSGDVRIRSPQSQDSQEQRFDMMIQELGLGNRTAFDRATALNQIPWQGLVTSAANRRCFPTQNSGFVGWSEHPSELKTQIAGVLARLKTLVVGDCKADVRTMATAPTAIPTLTAFHLGCRLFCNPESAQHV